MDNETRGIVGDRKYIKDEWWGELYICEQCKKETIWNDFKYCPNCGRKIIEIEKWEYHGI